MWWSSQTRARTRVPCIGRRTLNHCATREALFIFLPSELLHGAWSNQSFTWQYLLGFLGAQRSQIEKHWSNHTVSFTNQEAEAWSGTAACPSSRREELAEWIQRRLMLGLARFAPQRAVLRAAPTAAALTAGPLGVTPAELEPSPYSTQVGPPSSWVTALREVSLSFWVRGSYSLKAAASPEQPAPQMALVTLRPGVHTLVQCPPTLC